MNILSFFPSKNKNLENPEEADLISRCRKGDQDAFKEIFDRYHKRVYRIAYGMVRQKEDARDIVQEVFTKLFRSIQDFRGKSKFYTYLYRMAVNTTIDHTRKMGKFSAFSLDEEGAFEPSGEPEQRPDRIFLRKELEGKLNLALEKLPPDQRMALVLREVEGLSYQEMAEAMGCSIGTVMSRLHYARRRVQTLLKDYLKEGKTI